jgi:hypothetical protein
MRYLLGLWHLQQWRKEAYPVAAEKRQLSRSLAVRLGLQGPVHILKHPDICTPLTWGLMRPVILLPGKAESWSAEQWRLVLLHELSHIKRRDVLWQSLAYLSLALYWFNPLLWLAHRQLYHEAERACDDAVLAQGSQASSYAQMLLDFSRPAPRVPLSASALQLRKPFAKRISAILDPMKNRRATSRPVRLAVTGLTLALSLILASVELTTPADTANTLAQDTLIVQELRSAQPLLVTGDDGFVPGLLALPCTAAKQHCELIIIRLNPQQTLLLWHERQAQNLEERLSNSLELLLQQVRSLPEGWQAPPVVMPKFHPAYDL